MNCCEIFYQRLEVGETEVQNNRTLPWNTEYLPNALSGLTEHVLVCKPTTYFDAQAKEVLSSKKATSFEVEFNYVYLDGIQIAIESVRNRRSQEHLSKAYDDISSVFSEKKNKVARKLHFSAANSKGK